MGKIIQKEMYLCDSCGKEGDSSEIKEINISFDYIERLKDKHLCLKCAKYFGLISHMNGMFYIVENLKSFLKNYKVLLKRR